MLFHKLWMQYLLMTSLLGSDTMVMRFVKLNCYKTADVKQRLNSENLM
jgi:hypothetical protein